jgi:hypothetical protein
MCYIDTEMQRSLAISFCKENWKYVGHSDFNENLVPFRAQINLYEHACTDKLWHV